MFGGTCMPNCCAAMGSLLQNDPPICCGVGCKGSPPGQPRGICPSPGLMVMILRLRERLSKLTGRGPNPARLTRVFSVLTAAGVPLFKSCKRCAVGRMRVLLVAWSIAACRSQSSTLPSRGVKSSGCAAGGGSTTGGLGGVKAVGSGVGIGGGAVPIGAGGLMVVEGIKLCDAARHVRICRSG